MPRSGTLDAPARAGVTRPEPRPSHRHGSLPLLEHVPIDVGISTIDECQRRCHRSSGRVTVSPGRTLVDSYFDELVAACEATVVPDWTDRLAGADVFTADHCCRIIESMRID